jgi:CheY-like chemotaxis protein
MPAPSDVSCLYVEDGSLSRQVMQMIMERAIGVKSVAIFDHSEDFITRVKALPNRPDIILLDIHVRPVDGFEMLSQLRAEADFKSTMVVALTASVMNEEVEKLRTSGFNGAISKPVSVSTFPALFTRILNGETIWHIG